MLGFLIQLDACYWVEETGQKRIRNTDLVATNNFPLCPVILLAILLTVVIDHRFILYVCIPVFEEMVCYLINFLAFRGKEKL